MGSKEVAIKLYMHHMCPACHRILIILTELNIPFEKEILDLNVPRSPEYLKINPRGLVPAISYNGEIITESAIIAQFLVDTYPSHLLPASSEPKGPLIRARIGFFVDAWTTLCTGPYVKVLLASTEKEANEHVNSFAKTIAEEIDPLLKDSAPFFGGSDKLTLAEVGFSGDGKVVVNTDRSAVPGWTLRIPVACVSTRGLVPASLPKILQERSPNFYKWSEAIVAHPRISECTEVDTMVATTKERMDRLAKTEGSAELVDALVQRAGGN